MIRTTKDRRRAGLRGPEKLKMTAGVPVSVSTNRAENRRRAGLRRGGKDERTAGVSGHISTIRITRETAGVPVYGAR